LSTVVDLEKIFRNGRFCIILPNFVRVAISIR